MQRSKLLVGAIIGATALLVTAGAAAASGLKPANTVPATTNVTLPLFGAPLTVDITTGPGGTLTSVNVNPTTAPTDFTATNVKPNQVSFVNGAGTAKVNVGDRHGGQVISARAGTLADISGPGSWSGDVFGTGTATTVTFTIGAASGGGPDITGVTSTDTTAVIGATQYHTWTGHDSDDPSVQSADVKVTFTASGQSRSLVIGARLATESDGTTHASIALMLTRTRGVPQAADVAAGDKTWTGQLCDGSTATINYTVNADGTLTFGSATPTPAGQRTKDHMIAVQFADHQSVMIMSHMNDKGITVNVREMIRCKAAANPTTNVPVSTTTPPSAGSGWGGGSGWTGGFGGFGGGFHHRGG